MRGVSRARERMQASWGMAQSITGGILSWIEGVDHVAKVESTRHRWEKNAKGKTVCVGEALDERGKVVGRAIIHASWPDGEDHKHQHEIAAVEQEAGFTARALAENAKPPAK